MITATTYNQQRELRNKTSQSIKAIEEVMQMEAMSIDLHGHLGNRNLMKRYLLKLGHQELSLCVFSQYSVSLVTLGRKTIQANKDVNKSMTRTPTKADVTKA